MKEQTLLTTFRIASNSLSRLLSFTSASSPKRIQTRIQNKFFHSSSASATTHVSSKRQSSASSRSNKETTSLQLLTLRDLRDYRLKRELRLGQRSHASPRFIRVSNSRSDRSLISPTTPSLAYRTTSTSRLSRASIDVRNVFRPASQTSPASQTNPASPASPAETALASR